MTVLSSKPRNPSARNSDFLEGIQYFGGIAWILEIWKKSPLSTRQESVFNPADKTTVFQTLPGAMLCA